MNRVDWTLLAIASAEGQSLTPVQLQKSLFLLEQDFPEHLTDRKYNFFAYDYGPFSPEVYRDAEDLARQELVSISASGGGWALYSASPKGLVNAKQIASSAPADAIGYLQRVVAWARSLSFQQLVRAIYDRYPAYRENSVFQ